MGRNEALPSGDEHDESRHPTEMSRVVGKDIVTVDERGCGNDEVVGANGCPSGHQIGRHSRVGAGNLKVERKNWDDIQNSFDERSPSIPSVLGCGAVDADDEFRRSDARERGLLGRCNPIEILGLQSSPLDADEHAGVD